MRFLPLLLAGVAFVEVNLFFLRQHSHNVYQAQFNLALNIHVMKFTAQQAEMLRNLQEMQARLEKLEPVSDPLAPGKIVQDNP